MQVIDPATLLAIIEELRSRIAVLEAELAKRDAELAKRDAELAKRDAEIAKRDAELGRRDATIAAIAIDVTALTRARDEAERKARMDSSNSSKPPSSDPPWSAPKQSPTARNRAKRERKKQGAQKGHKGHHRELLPPERVHEVVVHVPRKCEACGSEGLVSDEAGEFWSHQVVDLVDGRLKVVEHRMFGGLCACGHRGKATLPASVHPHFLGPTMTALVVLLTGKYRLSKRRTRELLFDLFSLVVSVGTISACEARMSEALAEPVAEAESFIMKHDLVGVDETSHWEKGVRKWLWVAVTPLVVVFKILKTRATEGAKALLGEGFQGIVTSDQHGAYNWVDELRRQFCWAHLYRRFIGFSEETGEIRRFGRRLVRYTELMFAWWHALRDGRFTRAEFEQKMARLMPRVNQTLLEAAESDLPRLGGCARGLFMNQGSLWVFVSDPRVQPTNNESEQEVRDAAIRRKLSFGTQSERGSRFLERMLCVSASCRRQNRNVFSYLTEAYKAHLDGLPVPSIIPAQALE